MPEKVWSRHAWERGRGQNTHTHSPHLVATRPGLSVCLPVCQFVGPSLSLSVSQSVSVSVSVCQSVCLSVSVSEAQMPEKVWSRHACEGGRGQNTHTIAPPRGEEARPACLPVCLSVCQSVSVSVSQSVCRSLSLRPGCPRRCGPGTSARGRGAGDGV